MLAFKPNCVDKKAVVNNCNENFQLPLSFRVSSSLMHCSRNALLFAFSEYLIKLTNFKIKSDIILIDK